MLLSKQTSNKQGMRLMFALAEVSACCFSNSSLPSYLHPTQTFCTLIK